MFLFGVFLGFLIGLISMYYWYGFAITLCKKETFEKFIEKMKEARGEKSDD